MSSPPASVGRPMAVLSIEYGLSFSHSLLSLPFVAMDSRTDHFSQERGMQGPKSHEERLRSQRQQRRD